MREITPLEPIEPLKPIEPIEPIEPLKPIEPIEPIEPLKPIEPIEPLKPIESLQETPLMQPSEPLKEQPKAPTKEPQSELPKEQKEQPKEQKEQSKIISQQGNEKKPKQSSESVHKAGGLPTFKKWIRRIITMVCIFFLGFLLPGKNYQVSLLLVGIYIVFVLFSEAIRRLKNGKTTKEQRRKIRIVILSIIIPTCTYFISMSIMDNHLAAWLYVGMALFFTIFFQLDNPMERALRGLVTILFIWLILMSLWGKFPPLVGIIAGLVLARRTYINWEIKRYAKSFKPIDDSYVSEEMNDLDE